MTPVPLLSQLQQAYTCIWAYEYIGELSPVISLRLEIIDEERHVGEVPTQAELRPSEGVKCLPLKQRLRAKLR